MCLNFHLSPESRAALMFEQGRNKSNEGSVAYKNSPFERCLKFTGGGPQSWYTDKYTFYVLFIEGSLYLIVRRPLKKELTLPFVSNHSPSVVSINYVTFDFYLLGEGKPKEVKPFSWANHLMLLKVKQKINFYEYVFYSRSKYVSEIRNKDTFREFIEFYLNKQSLKEIVGM